MPMYAVMLRDDDDHTWLVPKSAESSAGVIEEVVENYNSESGEWDKEIAIFPLNNPIEFTPDEARKVARND